MFENYVLVLFQEEYYYTIFGDGDRKQFLKAMEDRGLLDPFPFNKPKDWEIQISVECQRICEVKNEMES